ncbi:MAG: phosphate ABC transporter permease PstA [Acidimicrobiales bacterium]
MATTFANGDIRTASLSRSRRLREGLATGAMWASLALAGLVLGFIIYFLLARGARAINWEFLTGDIPRNFRAPGGGIGPAILGTVVITGGAAAIAVPLGLLGAIYLNEYGGQARLASFIRFMADVMTGVPSIVMGLFIYTAWVVRFESQSGFAGALALAALMLPIVIRSSEEILRLVPDDLREASEALGAPRWRTTLQVVLPAAASGITSGAMLAIARAAGETAPLIFTIGVAYEPRASLRGQNTALSAQIFRNASQPFAGAQDRAWGAALTLVVIVFVFTVLGRLVSRR